MGSKSASPGPSAKPAAPAKQTRSRKGTPPSQAEQGRAGSAGGVVLPKGKVARASTSPSKKTTAAVVRPSVDTAAAEAKTPRRKPRKLNKSPTSTPINAPASPTRTSISKGSPPSSELEALKARVRELEAKVEELYKTGATSDARGGRSPRRRGKGRKASSTVQLTRTNTNTSDASVNNARGQEVADNDEEDADEELVRLEGELEVARQDLEHYRPKTRRARSDETEYVEEIPRRASNGGGTERQVTLSGSYRIPIPASVNLEDVQTIKSGVSAAQNVARSFLEQRRAAAAAARTTQDTRPSASTTRPQRSMSSNLEVAVDNRGGKQSWSDWIGGYSMAITRAVSKIEHEAAVEAQMARGNGGGGGGGGGRRTSVPTSKKMAGKRPAARATLSGEQVHGLMS
ncbi:hypothetical protein COCC4DRAFT_173281 [Bipolaris maydis ATCC 48331]|uniref:Uncharacterized protein n=2 Tax=Cochliobolus heterostrophus TaxID=5016 RepID=M2UIX7_COCH5|nr:uncharacterized protein COCC4DRAFT_173281 [Bipolaris maydis ATCC 48331]EMD87948.1 hypothetical protein COCHEDRAFT_1183087 [Bipolaris maydis C5]KAH7552185.1 hypothetical protein BM1_09047 [Bipolaris maydis]ENI03463.1 hypothetical protein COCC4DRAFT_173281 [Bipolaris maydis ATCC 48331]KAJ5024231.1 hypothetical protein J3E73DRAFT_383503 [Bipolaris maydis]KAJ5057625.1 hypothetical protein J3E74DRAFT_276533 [Bipolaris maydis]